MRSGRTAKLGHAGRARAAGHEAVAARLDVAVVMQEAVGELCGQVEAGDRHAQPGEVRQMVRDERLDAVVIQPNRVEHAGGRLDRPPRCVPDPRLSRDRLGQNAAQPCHVHQPHHLPRITKGARRHQYRIRQPQPATLNREVNRGRHLPTELEAGQEAQVLPEALQGWGGVAHGETLLGAGDPSEAGFSEPDSLRRTIDHARPQSKAIRPTRAFCEAAS